MLLVILVLLLLLLFLNKITTPSIATVSIVPNAIATPNISEAPANSNAGGSAISNAIGNSSTAAAAASSISIAIATPYCYLSCFL